MGIKTRHTMAGRQSNRKCIQRILWGPKRKRKKKALICPASLVYHSMYVHCGEIWRLLSNSFILLKILLILFKMEVMYLLTLPYYLRKKKLLWHSFFIQSFVNMLLLGHYHIAYLHQHHFVSSSSVVFDLCANFFNLPFSFQQLCRFKNC